MKSKITWMALTLAALLVAAPMPLYALSQVVASGTQADMSANVEELANPVSSSPGDIITVIEQTIIDDKAVFATVRSSDKAEARARINGTIVSLEVDEGTQVKRGQHIATVVDDQLKLKERSTEAAIKAAKARLQKADSDYRRGQNLIKRGVIAKAKLDELKAAYDVAVNDLSSAEAEQSVLAEQIIQGDVLAPADGRVLTVPVTQGSVVLAGESIATIAANQYILRLELPERHARYIKKGDTVMVGARGLDPLEQTAGEGIISQVYPELENGRVIADVEIAKLGDYFVGERALVRIAADKRKALVIPRNFTFKRYGLDYVKLLADDGKPMEVVVQLGGPVLLGRGRGGVEVLGGLKPGDRLVRP